MKTFGVIASIFLPLLCKMTKANAESDNPELYIQSKGDAANIMVKGIVDKKKSSHVSCIIIYTLILTLLFCAVKLIKT